MVSKNKSTKKLKQKTVSTDRFNREVARSEQIEKKLQESEERFKDIAENALEWIWEVDAFGKYTYASSVVERVLGYKPKEILKKHFYDLFHPEDKERLKRIVFDVFFQKKPFREFTHRNMHKNKREVWLSTSGVPMFDKKGKFIGYRGADIDITARKKIEEKLLASEEKFRLIFENAKDAIIWVESKTGKIIKCNKATEILLERERGEILGFRQEDFYSPKKKNYYKKRFQVEIKKKRVFDEEIEIITKSGEIKFVYMAASMTSVGGGRVIQVMFHDVTKQKKIEKELLESTMKLSKIFNGLNESIMLINKRGYITEVNKALLEDSGYKRKELVGKHILKTGAYIDNKSKKLILETFLKRLSGGALEPIIVDFKIKSGEIRKVEISSSLIEKEGKIDSMVALLRDVTEEKKTEKKVKESYENLKEVKDSLEIRVDARTKELRELAESLDRKVKQQTEELQKKVNELAETKTKLELKVEQMEAFNKITMGREEKILELKSKIEELEGQLKRAKKKLDNK